MKKVIITAIVSIVFFQVAKAQIPGNFFDSRDGRAYKTLLIEIELEGGIYVFQEWMAENLKYNSPESYCYKNYPAYCEVYGKLYTWKDALTVCPEGWHIPSSFEWQSIYKKYGSIKNAGRDLLEDGDSGLGLIMGGFGELDGSYIDVGVNAYYWKTLDLANNASGLIAVHSDTGEISDVEIADRHKNSIRCVKKYDYAGR